MSPSRQQLHALVDMVEEEGISTLYNVMLRFIPEDDAAPDEIAAMAVGDEEYKRGEYVTLESIL